MVLVLEIIAIWSPDLVSPYSNLLHSKYLLSTHKGKSISYLE